MFKGPLKEQSQEVKCNYLMLWVGEKGRSIFSTWRPTDDEQKDLTYFYNQFENYCKPKSNRIYSRYIFKMKIQKDGESFEQFVTDLRLLIKECDYPEDILDDMIRDHIVFGVRSVKLREKFISEGNGLTLQKSLDIARTYELTKSHIQQMDNNKSVNAVTPRTYHHPEAKRNPKQRSRGKLKYANAGTKKAMCSNCGSKHETKDICPARGKDCNYCGKRNHFVSVCYKKQKEQNKSRVHEVNDFSSSDLSDNCDGYFVNTVTHDKHKNQAFVNISVGNNSTQFKFKIDSGAQVNIIPYHMYKSLGSKIQLKHTNSKLTAYNGTSLKVHGVVSLQCLYNGKISRNEFYTVDTPSCPILGLDTCLAMNLLKFVSAVEPDVSYTKDQVISKYHDVFTGLGTLPGECDIHIKSDAIPVVHPPRRVPIAIKDRLKTELDRMVKDKVIVKVTEPSVWVNSMVTVEKPNGSLRVCLDPKDLNEAIVRPHYPSRSIDDILPDLTGASVFSKFDARTGYWSVKLNKKSSFLTVFNTPFGRYRYLRLPYGVNCAQDVFVQKMESCLEGLNGVKVIVDDIVCYGKDKQEHDRNLDKLMERCQLKGLKLNADKTEIGKSEIPFFGHLLTSDGLKIDPSKVRAVQEMPSPKSKSELETILGMVNYLQRFAPNLAEMTSLLRQLLKKDSIFRWDPEHEIALNKIKRVITQNPGQVLSYFDPNIEVVLQVDASQNGLGCVLLQNDKPVFFASKALTSAERNYAQITKELYAVLYGMTKFHQMTYGRHVVVQSDHKPLVSITRKSLHVAPPRLQKMILQLQKYDYEIVHVPGKDIPVADTLSRNYLQDEQIDVCKDIDVHVHSVMENIAMSDQKMTLIKSKIQTDQEMQTLKHTILTGWPDKRQNCPNSILQYWNFRDKLTVIDDFLLKGNNVIIPKGLRHMMLDKVHDSHLGMIEKCTQRARSVMFWPNMTKDIKNKVLNCPICLEHRNSNVKEPMIPNQIPSRPWEVVATDIFHWNDSNYIVVVDLYSRYFECGLLRNMRTDTVIHKLKGYFATHGIPSKVISDNAGQYCSQEFDKFAREWDFEHVTSSPLHSQGNGVAERCIQTIKKIFTKSLQDNKDPYLAVLEYRNAPLSCGKSPVQLLMSRETRSILPVTRKHLEPKVQNRQEIKSKMSKSKIKSKTWFDKSAKPLTQLSQGETIRIKQGKRWKQAIVRKQVHDRSYIVETNDGGVYRRNRNHLLKTNEKPFQIIDTHPCNGNDIRLTDQSQNDSDRNIQNQSERNFSHDNTQSQQQQPSAPTNVAGNTDQNSNMYVTRSGRQVKVPQRLDL
ncbi:uncharacterized protein K02A2.6-like isoform X1 [Mya arenaria]|uniref:uncharacterized protein K02A2.6-like isoform X1 n=1 Tax=Mya arenaria TaxID=6604 RepID=UPI0022E1AF77|nr:uncharacterized protein K02A2.6-like isoform X1 [Mya arenaria]